MGIKLQHIVLTILALLLTLFPSSKIFAKNRSSINQWGITWTFDKEYYCDPANGNMSNNGTKESPWASLEEVISSGKTFEGGEVIYLMNGNHGYPQIASANTANVTITKAPGEDPVLYRLKFAPGASHWVVKDVKITTNGARVITDPPLEHPVYAVYNNSLLTIDGADNIKVQDCFIYSIENASVWNDNDWNYHSWNGLYHKESDSVIIQNCHFKNVNFGMHNNNTNSNTLYEYNTIENFCGDGMRAMGTNTVIQYNTIKNVYDINGNHDDMIQGLLGTDSVVLRGNKLFVWTDANQPFKGSAQGIGCFDGMFDGWVVENNLVVCDHWHGISFLGATNCKIINNTVIDINDSSPGPAWILVGPHKDGTSSSGNIVRNNICNSIHSDCSSSGTVDHNIEIGYSDYSAYFTDSENFNFSLKFGSPPIDAGSPDQAPSLDINGNSRPQDEGYDVGAYEFYGVPTVQSSNISLMDYSDTSLTISWDKGNGIKRIVWATIDTTGTSAPVDGISYTADSTYGNGSELNGWYCIYKGEKENIKVTGLHPNTKYRFHICEYMNYSTPNYLTDAAIGNPANFTTDFSTPTTQASNITCSNIHIHVYPNPADEMLHVNIQLNAISDLTIKITNTVNQAVYTKKLSNIKTHTGTIDVSEWSSGLYLMQVMSDEGIKTVTLVVE
jgi:hypothetical protein